MSHTYKYKKGDSILVQELAKGLTIRDAAKLAGISEQTVYRRMKKADFRAEISRIRTMFLRQAAGRLAASSSEAADILMTLAKSEKSAGHVQRSAASDILAYSMKLLELSELDERLRQLEEIMHNEK